MSNGLGSMLGVLGQMMGGQQPGAGQAGGGAGGLGAILAGLQGRQGGGAEMPRADGNLGALAEMFEQHGMGGHMKSRASTGENQPISPDDISKVFGPDRLGRIAASAGVGQAEAAGGLADILPKIVDGMTPQARVVDLPAWANRIWRP